MNYPTATTSARYGSRVLTATFWIETDRRGNPDIANSYAQLKLEDLGELRFPLIWSRGVTVEQAHAAIEIFEATGVTLQ